jgi:hypothetical protein
MLGLAVAEAACMLGMGWGSRWVAQKLVQQAHAPPAPLTPPLPCSARLLHTNK